MINSIATLIDSIAPQPTEYDFARFIDICQIADISPYDAAALTSDDPDDPTNPLIPDIIRFRNFLFTYADDARYADESPYSYYSDSCLDELIEMLDFDKYSNDDEYALARRIDSYCYDHDIDPDEFDNRIY